MARMTGREADMDAVRLPFDYSRCQGRDCDRKDDCLRHAALADMGPRTPINARLCEIGHEAESFIAIREEVEQ